jgi:hypothetical protein
LTHYNGMDFSITGIHTTRGKDNFTAQALIDLVSAGLEDSGATLHQDTYRKVGLFLGSTFSNYYIRQDNAKKYYDKGVRILNPADFPKCLISYLGGLVCTTLHIQGVNSTVSSGRSSGIDALTQGLFFLERSSAHKAVIVELDEVSTSRGTFSRGGACVVIESTQSAKNSYGNIIGVESFFEKKGEVQGLERALKAAVAKMPEGWPVENVFCAVTLKKRMDSLRKSPHSGFSGVSNISYSDSGGICGIAEILKAIKYSGHLDKELGTKMFLNLGENTNSNCVAFRCVKRKENSCERKKQQRKIGQKGKVKKTR